MLILFFLSLGSISLAILMIMAAMSTPISGDPTIPLYLGGAGLIGIIVSIIGYFI